VAREADKGEFEARVGGVRQQLAQHPDRRVAHLVDRVEIEGEAAKPVELAGQPAGHTLDRREREVALQLVDRGAFRPAREGFTLGGARALRCRPARIGATGSAKGGARRPEGVARARSSALPRPAHAVARASGAVRRPTELPRRHAAATRDPALRRKPTP
jgi:hypothetical protein